MTIRVPLIIDDDGRRADVPDGILYTNLRENGDGTVTVTLKPDSAREWRMKEVAEAAEQDRADFDEFFERVGNATQPNAVRDIAKDMAEKRKGRRQG